jgi:hypothetical protein
VSLKEEEKKVIFNKDAAKASIFVSRCSGGGSPAPPVGRELKHT